MRKMSAWKRWETAVKGSRSCVVKSLRMWMRICNQSVQKLLSFPASQPELRHEREKDDHLIWKRIKVDHLLNITALLVVRHGTVNMLREVWDGYQILAPTITQYLGRHRRQSSQSLTLSSTIILCQLFCQLNRIKRLNMV